MIQLMAPVARLTALAAPSDGSLLALLPDLSAHAQSLGSRRPSALSVRALLRASDTLPHHWMLVRAAAGRWDVFMNADEPLIATLVVDDPRSNPHHLLFQVIAPH